MKRDILISTSPNMTRIALVEDQQAVELMIEPMDSRRLVGNIYFGRVSRVLPGMQAAFVDIGLERDAFLYVQDVAQPDHLLVTPEPQEDMDLDGSDPAEIPLGMPPEQNVPIDQLLHPGQTLLVQVNRPPMKMKGARISAHISLPGRYLVLMPTLRHIGISQKIESEEERTRLRDTIQSILDKPLGVIARTLAENKSETQLQEDLLYLSEVWSEIHARSQYASPPQLLHQDLSPSTRVLRDLFDDSISGVYIDSLSEYERCREFVGKFAPRLLNTLHLHKDRQPLFEKTKVEGQIEKALQRKIWLPSGGYLVFDQAEALVAIDVNTGRFVGKDNLEDTVFQTNLEAADMIARQVRLRDLGGIIVIDFIDMEDEEHREKVHGRLEQAFSADRSRVHIAPFTEMGLVELTRKRLRRSLGSKLRTPCPCCKGTGSLLHPRAVAVKIVRELHKRVYDANPRGICVHVDNHVRPYLEEELEERRAQFSRQGKQCHVHFVTMDSHEHYTFTDLA